MTATTTAGQLRRRLLAEIGGDDVGGQMLPARRVAQLAAEFGAVHHRHLQVGQHQIDRLMLQDIECQLTVGRADHLGPSWVSCMLINTRFTS